MKVKVTRKGGWVFGFALWSFLGKMQLDIGFWHWHIYIIFGREDLNAKL